MASPEVRGVGQSLDYIGYVWVSKALRTADFIISKMRNHWRVLSRETFKKHPSSSVILNCGLCILFPRGHLAICRHFQLPQLGVMVYATGISG